MSNYQGPMRLAHRGLTREFPENTFEAVRAAYERGLEGAEIDIQMSRDGEIVVFHDDNLTRMTCGHPTKFSNARVCELDWEELSKVEIPYANHQLDTFPEGGYPREGDAIRPFRILGQERRYEDELKREPRMAHISTLKSLLEWMDTLKRPFELEIEYKADDMMPRLAELLQGCRARANCIVFSGYDAHNEQIQRFAAQEGLPDGVRLGANLRFLNETALKRLDEWQLWEIGLNMGATAEDVRYLHDRGVHAFSNLGDTPEGWKSIVGNGFDGFKTNYANEYTDWWSRTR